MVVVVKSRFITSATVEVDVDIYSDDLDDETLREICEERGITSNGDEDVTEMFYAFKLGRTERAMELARKIAMDKTGGIL